MKNIINNFYKDAVALLTSQGKFHIKLGLERVQELLEFFGNPQDRVKCIHVAGTNGKGSTCAMLDSILREAGYKTGLYTSPHLVEYTERIKINAQDITQEEFARLIFEVVKYSQKANIPATEFEILTVASFIYFFEQKVDYAVIETGLGGRLDATNVIKKPELTIITSIDIDHADRLGSTIEEIAYEKAGIIKENTSVITLNDNNGLEVIKNSSLKNHSPLILAEQTDEEIALSGLWQKKNAALARKAAEVLNMPEKTIKIGLKNVKWPARFQYIESENLLIDAAHNPAGALSLRQSLDFYFPDTKRVFVYSSLKTKSHKEITRHLFRKEDIIILTKCSSFSAEEPEIIKQSINCNQIHITQSIKEAACLYKKFSKNQFLIIITGSIYTIGEYLSS